MAFARISSPKLAALCGLLLGGSEAASAQAVNYAELQDLFGEPVTTSVSGKPQRASDAPAALVIITQDDIRRSPAHDIPGLLQAYAGIDVTRWTAQGTDVAIRGGVQPFNPRLLVLVNGRQAYLDYYGMTNWAGLGVQLGEIQQIEVVKGSNSALFGFNAVSGVINIITVNPLHSQGASMTAGIGTHGQVFGSGVASIKLATGLGLRVSGGYEASDELRGLAGSALTPGLSALTYDPQHKEVAAELYAQLGERTEGSLSATHSRNRQLEIVPVPFTLPDSYEFTSVSGRLSHDTGWGVLSANGFHNWSGIHSDSVGQTLDYRNKTFVASASALIRAGATNTLRVGAEYRSNLLRVAQGFPGATRYKVLAASGMWESRLSENATFTVAGRVDRLKLAQEGQIDQPTIFTKADFDRTITEWSFNSALLLKVGERSTLRLAASKGVQLPSLFAFGARLVYPIAGTPLSLINSGNPRIDPAKIWNGEIGFTRALGDGGRLELAAFYSRTHDLIAPASPQAPPFAVPPAYPFILTAPANVGTFEAYGLEASLSGRLSPALSWSLNYTWTHADQRIPGNGNGNFDWPLALDSATPEHKIKAQLSYERGPWLATLAARYTSPTEQLIYKAVPEGPLGLVKVDDSLSVDAKVAFRISDKLRLAVSGDNLTGADGAYLSPAPAERRVRVSAEIGF